MSCVWVREREREKDKSIIIVVSKETSEILINFRFALN